ncbi:hypothetical protein BCF33_0426 [Hasllibacter halocynthiae]|uniref:CASTOR ACT domain-containing protein n=1 Tax=Hasllibacter halocynthiae TaxID=595589 RepID=A0A2T0X7F1_9RHOB|nr:ACT domain-containing protein [Hasllibacter halocynthiae]PRY94825.1 hypothetical protein BCF33_0426 [Hasllibacter halocynthiae]
MSAVRDGAAMIAGMAPERRPGAWTFAACEGTPPAGAIATFCEVEGWSCIRPAAEGEEAFALISLRVHSALDGVGLTAAVSGALAREGIACNVVAALRHDHLFVPEADDARALAVLERLSEGSR